jgi:hypothetical protein
MSPAGVSLNNVEEPSNGQSPALVAPIAEAAIAQPTSEQLREWSWGHLAIKPSSLPGNKSILGSCAGNVMTKFNGRHRAGRL